MKFEDKLEYVLADSTDKPKTDRESILWNVYIRGRYSIQLVGRIKAPSEAIAIEKARKYNSNAFVVRSDQDDK